MVTPPREAKKTVAFIDQYCWLYRSLFKDVRYYENFKYLHVGMLSEIKRKSLPLIARTVGLKDQGQSLHHFLKEAEWKVEDLRETRLWLTKLLIGEREVVLLIDETGDEKKGKTTDYVARQYIGNLGKTENGIVSVNSYAVVEGITYPLIFKIFKPKTRLKPGEIYQTKPQLAVAIIEELKTWGLRIKLVLADSLYGESGDVIEAIGKQKLKYIVAIRSNHGVWMLPGQRVRYNSWLAYEQKLQRKKTETRYIREIIFGKRRAIRYYQISKKDAPDPSGDESWYIMTNLEGQIQKQVGGLYSLRNWIEYGFKQIKDELGWADFRVTDYASIERWWEIVMSAYLLVSLQANYFQLETLCPFKNESVALSTSQLSHHPLWEEGINWKSALNNLRLIIQPYTFYNLLQPWLEVFKIPKFRRCFFELIEEMNQFLGFSCFGFSNFSLFPFLAA
jgi:SRSO17 transposase